VTFQDGYGEAGTSIPYARGVVVGASKNSFPVAAKRNCVDTLRMALENEGCLGCGLIPYLGEAL
jgi:hypothetical protein